MSQTNCTRLVKVVLKWNALLHCEQSHLSVCVPVLRCYGFCENCGVYVNTAVVKVLSK